MRNKPQCSQCPCQLLKDGSNLLCAILTGAAGLLTQEQIDQAMQYIQSAGIITNSQHTHKQESLAA